MNWFSSGFGGVNPSGSVDFSRKYLLWLVERETNWQPQPTVVGGPVHTYHDF